MKHVNGLKTLVFKCANLVSDDSVLIIYSSSTKQIGLELFNIIDSYFTLDYQPRLLQCDDIRIHGQEPSSSVVEAISQSTIVFCLTKYSLAHSKVVTHNLKRNLRFLSLPDFSFELLSRDSMNGPFDKSLSGCHQVLSLFSGTNNIHVKTKAGTDIRFSISNRHFNSAPGSVVKAGDLSSPPDIECNVAPIEDSAEGLLVIDGSIPVPGIGLLQTPVYLELKSGKIVLSSMSSDNKQYVQVLHNYFSKHISNRTLGEFGIGLNPCSRLSDSMLESEGAFNTCHFGFGSNTTIGGQNRSSSHVDAVLQNPLIFADSFPVNPFKTFLNFLN